MNDDSRIDSILGEWRARRDAGDAVTPDELIAAHPDLAESLRARFDALAALSAAKHPSLRDVPADRYAEFRVLGEGGMGIVYWALDTDLNREVAFKVVRPDAGRSAAPTPTAPIELCPPEADTPASQAFATLKARFLQEAWVTAGLEHPGIVPVYEVGQTLEGVPYYTMRFVRGSRTFASAIEETRGRPADERLALLEPFLRVCDTIRYAHAHGVVHRDLKPDNVALGEFGEVVVLDWGLAKMTGKPDAFAETWRHRLQEFRDASDLRTMASALGTPGYMSPEAALGRTGEVDAKSDVYSLGAMLFQILTGRLAYEFASYGELAMKLMKEDPPSPDAVDPSVPAELARICVAALERDRSRRTASVDALVADVRGWLAQRAADRELDALREQAKAAFGAASGLTGDLRLHQLDRAASACDQVLAKRADDAVASSLRRDIDALRAKGVEERERLARGEVRRRARNLSLAGAAVGLVGFVCLLAVKNDEVGDALATAKSETAAKEAALGNAERARAQADAERDAKGRALDVAVANLDVSRAIAALERDPGTALVLARDAVRRAPTAEGNAVLLEALSRNREIRRYAGTPSGFGLLVVLDSLDGVGGAKHVPGFWLDPANDPHRGERYAPDLATPSSDGRSIAAAVFVPERGLAIIDAQTLAPRAFAKLEYWSVATLTLSRDGRLLVVGAGIYDGKRDETLPFVAAFDATTLEPLGKSRLDDAPLAIFEDVAASRFLVRTAHSLVGWTPKSDPKAVPLEGSGQAGFAVHGCFEGGGRAVAVVSVPTKVGVAPGLAVRLVDLASGGTLGTVDVRGEEALLSPAGNALIAFGADDVVGFADLRSYRATERRLHAHTGYGARVRVPVGRAFTKDGALVALSAGESDDDDVWIGDPATGEQRIAVDGAFGGLECLAFVNGEKWLAACSGGWEEVLHVWDLLTPLPVRAWAPEDATSGKAAAAASPRPIDAASALKAGSPARLLGADGAEVVVAKVGAMAGSPDGTRIVLHDDGGTGAIVLLVARADLRVLRRWEVRKSVIPGAHVVLFDFSFDARGRRIAAYTREEYHSEDGSGSSSGDGWLVFDVESGALRGDVAGVGFDSVRISPDGSRVFGTIDGTVCVWDAGTGDYVATLAPRMRDGLDADVGHYELLRDGRTIAVGTRHGVVALYEAERYRRVFTGLTQLDDVGSVEISPDGRLLLASDGSDVELWRIADATRIVKLPKALAGGNSEFVEAGAAVVTTGPNGRAVRWPTDPLSAAEGFVCDPRAMPSQDRSAAAGRPESAELRALEIVESLQARRWNPTRPFREDLAKAIDDPAVFPEELRTAARAILSKGVDDANELDGLAWGVVSKAGADAGAYREALTWAARAVELAPKDDGALNTLGVAQLRTGEFAAALETLMKIDTESGGNKPSHFAFLAMANARVGRADEAARDLERMREEMKRWARNFEGNEPFETEEKRIAGEAEVVVGGARR